MTNAPRSEWLNGHARCGAPSYDEPGEEEMASLTRRDLLRGASTLCLGMASVTILAACKQRIIRVERIIPVEKEITRIVKEVVRETIIVKDAPEIIERTVEKIITSTPPPERRSSAPSPKTTIVADVMDYGWTQFALLMTPAFEEMFPQITMKWRSLSKWHEYPQKIAALHASDQLGDLLEGPSRALLGRWVYHRIIQPIDPIIAADGFDTSGIFGGALKACRFDNRQMGLPFIGHAGENLLLYNQGLFDEASIEHPRADWTLDDLVEAGEMLTQDRDGDNEADQFGYVVRYDLPSAYPMLPLFGANLFDRAGRRCLIEDENGIDCLEWAYHQIYRRNIAPHPYRVEKGVLEMFRTGRLAMLRHSFKTLIELSRIAESPRPLGQALKPTIRTPRRIGSSLFPQHPRTRKRGALASGMAYCISRKSRIADQVFQWIKFMSGREMGVQMFLGDFAQPGCRLASWKDTRVIARMPICAQLADVANEAQVERLPWNLRTRECLDVWNKSISSLLLNEITPRECANLLRRGINRVLAMPRLDETL